VLCHGPVRVPVDAKPGKAIIRFELPKASGYASVPTDLGVELIGKTEKKKAK
jgi:hypothetical protein